MTTHTDHKSFQSTVRGEALKYITDLVSTSELNVDARVRDISFLEAHRYALKLIADKVGGIRHGFVIGHIGPNHWYIPSVDYEYRDRVLVDCLTGLNAIGTFHNGDLAVHTVYGMDDFPFPDLCLVGVAGSPLWARDGSDYHSTELVTCTISH